MARRCNIFIDGQNVPARYIPDIVEYCASNGLTRDEARLYASPNQIGALMGAGTLLADHDVDPVPVPCKPGKNSVDIRIAVDVIEDACRDRGADAVVLVTNDSDFTHVASRVISYGTEFHLLYTTDAKPAGYSTKASLRRIGAAAKSKKAAQPAPRPAKPAPPLPPPPPKPEYRHDLPLAKLDVPGFVERILATSPLVLDSRWLSGAWRDFTGKAWKGKASKKTPQQLFDERFAGTGYRFVQWPELPLNQGYFLRAGRGELHAPGGHRNPALSLLGADHELVTLQAAVLAGALRSASHADFNRLYDGCAAANVLPRYSAWAILHCWLKAQGAATTAPVQPVERNAEVAAEHLVAALDAEVRRQLETGEVALRGAGPPAPP